MSAVRFINKKKNIIVMDFSKEELNKIKNDEIFTKKVNSHLYWIKPVYEHKSYPIGSIKSCIT